ncbi:MAG: CoA transferase [Acetobacteraceae bacterium]|nr:CoA transferase [Acetobacteraceae bacterium]
MATPIEALRAVWAASGMPADPLEDVTLTGADPALPSSFAVGTAAQASVAAGGLAAATLGRMRGLPRQGVAVDMRHAATEFHSEGWLQVNAAPTPDPWDRVAGTYPCGDGRFVRLHTNFPHHRDGVLRLLGCAHEREAVREALQAWEAFAFEDAAAEAGLCVTAMRRFEEWDAHPQGRAVQAEPLIGFERIGEAPPRGLPPGDRPLSGVRVLDLTRVIAGPVCGRTLAAHGADVLLITAPHLYSVPSLVIDTGRGKLSAQLDLREAEARATLRGLLAEADVVVQGYRPGAIAGHGFGPAEAAATRPGIVYVSLCAYGYSGPWRDRRGFDSLVQTASGFNAAEAEAAGQPGPKALPVQVLDHASGHLLALGAMAGLYRRATEGGSWHVRVSLARTGHWVRGLGRVPGGLARAAPTRADIAPFLEESDSGFGHLSGVRHATTLAATPARWDRPSVPPGTHAPCWPPLSAGR